MTKFNKIISATLLMGAMVTMAACQKQEGPAERAGKEVDQAVTQAGQKIENAGDKIQETAQGDK